MNWRPAATLLSLLALSSAAVGDGGPRVKPHALTQGEIGSRLRVFAKAGDLALSNAVVTAVVRKSDGFLTEFWRNRATLPTTEQLGTLTDIDAIWQIHPVVRRGDDSAPVLASRVAVLADGIEVEGVAELGGVKYRAVTVHRLHPSEPRLLMTTTFHIESGADFAAVNFGDEVKWGNTTYYVEGVAKPRLKFKGHADWIGRRGAGGDLMLRPKSVPRLFADYAASAKFPGFLGAISALYQRKGIAAGQSVTVSRELAFETLPVPRPAPPKETGTLALAIRDEGDQPIAAKVRVDRDGQAAPVFALDGDLDGADRFLWTGNGKVERALPPGRYTLLATAGIERDAWSQSVVVRAGQTTSLEARLPRVIDTPGWVAADLHLHQAPSVDADIALPARVVAIAAEGVEFAVATDHYVVTDLAPTVRYLKDRGVLRGDLQTLPGSEVSTLGRRFGHFNVFPLQVGSNVRYLDVTPSELFADARKQSPGGILQVNHPRFDPKLGYFTYHGIDDATGEMRVAGYDPSFDTLEVYNGDDAYDIKRVRKVLLDWMHLLGRGQRYAATGSSDSHNLAFLDPGLPRTLIRWGKAASDADDVRAPTRAVLDALKAGHAIVTSGPVLDVSVDGKGPGESAKVGKTAKLHVVVRAAPWISVSSLEILQGGSAKQVKWLPLKRGKGALVLDRTFDLPVSEKTFFVVLAQGDRGLPNASREGSFPLAFSNPIWVEP